MFKSLITLTSCNFKNIFQISKNLHALKSYEPETFISEVYFGGEARHAVHRASNARLANEQKRNRQILGAFFIFHRPWLGIGLGGVPKNVG